MTYAIEHITDELTHLIEELSQNSKSHENFRMGQGDPSNMDNHWRWRLFAEPKGQGTTHFAGVQYYPAENLFRGDCNGSYELREIDEVKERICGKFL